MIAIIDYGMGNLRSVAKGFEKMGVSVKVTNDPAVVEESEGAILPGVGAFSEAMRNLRDLGMVDAIYRFIETGKPFMGICLGMQLLLESSEEWGATTGLGIFPGKVRHFPPGLKIPQIGWNTVSYKKTCPLFNNVPENSAFYFVHSYYVEPADPVITTGTTDYIIEFASVVANKNVFGIQFHPEKSSALGLQILQNFGGLVEK